MQRRWWWRPKSMILGPLDAEWGADHDATVRMCRQAIDRRVEMKNWPFDGLKNDRRGEKWPEFGWYYRWNHDVEGYRSSVTWQSTTLTNFEESRRQSRYARQYCENDDKDNDSLAKARRPHYAPRRFIRRTVNNYYTASLRAMALRSASMRYKL